jgi:hypothetical protein
MRTLSLLLCFIVSSNAKAQSFSYLRKKEDSIISVFKNRQIDTMLLFKFESFAYLKNDASDFKILLWRKNALTFQQFIEDSSLSKIFQVPNTFIDVFLINKIGRKKNKKLVRKVHRSNAIGYINPLSYYYYLHFYYSQKVFSKNFLEHEVDLKDGDFYELYKKEIDWFQSLKKISRQ